MSDPLDEEPPSAAPPSATLPSRALLLAAPSAEPLIVSEPPSGQGMATPPRDNIHTTMATNMNSARQSAAERGTQRLFAWNRAHWIGMVVLIAVLLLLQWSSSMYLMPDEVLDRAAKNLFVWFPGMVLHWPLVLGITNLILGSIRSGSLSFLLASAIIGPLAFGCTNLRLRPGFPYRSWAQGKAAI